MLRQTRGYVAERVVSELEMSAGSCDKGPFVFLENLEA